MPKKKELAAVAEPQVIVRETANQIDLNKLVLPEDNDALWTMAVNSEVKATLEQVKAGFAYKELKNRLPHGDFQKGLKLRGIPGSTARSRMGVANLFLNFIDPKRPTSGVLESETPSHLIQLSFSQLIELSYLPEEKIVSLAPADIEEFGKLPVKALKPLVREIRTEFEKDNKLEAENANLKKQLEESQLREAQAIQSYNEEALKKSPDSQFGLPPLISHIKQKAPELTQVISEAGMDLLNLAEQLLQPGLDPEQVEQGARALHRFLEAPYMQLGVIINRIETRFTTDVYGEHASMPLFDEDEWMDAETRRKAVIEIYEARFHPKGAKKRGRK